MLVVMAGDALVARVGAGDGSTSLGGFFDLDLDGRSEVLLQDGFTNQGNTTGNARLVRVDRIAGGDGSLKVIRDFRQVYFGGCGAVPASGDSFSIIRATVTPGAAPAFRLEKTGRSCP